MTDFTLNDWRLEGYHPQVPRHAKTMEMGTPILGILTAPVPAKVPGSVYDALLEAGEIADPNISRNSLAAEWVAARWWIYTARIDLDPSAEERWELTAEGLDYDAEISVNGIPAASHQNVFVPCTADVTAMLRPGENEIRILLKSVPDEMGQIGRTSAVHTQKPRYAYKWDFCPRLPGMGIWGCVRLCGRSGGALRDVWFDCGNREDGSFRVRCEVENFSGGTLEAEVSLSKEGETVFRAVRTVRGARISFSGRICALPWTLRLEGTPALYELCVCLSAEGKLVDCVRRRVGFRRVEFLPNPCAPEGALPYTLSVNGETVYLKGANVVPLDLLCGRITAERGNALLESLAEMNVNLIRVWGGGVIESDTFYETCDRLGILVWQDMIQSSSGIDNHPSEDPGFLKSCRETARAAALRLRSHPSLAAFCGGNELAAGAERTPLGREHPLLAAFAKIFSELAPDTRFFPTTPSGPSFEKNARRDQNHDVHAPWLYLGPEAHYAYCNDFFCLFHGEYGCNGMSEVNSLRQFLEPKDLGVFDMRENAVWRHHGETWDTKFRDAEIFGEPACPEEFVLASQFLQAEGLRYLIQTDRLNAPRCAGGMIWAANESFPNVSNCSLIDYYGRRKLAYYVAKRCYAACDCGVRYDSLFAEPGGQLALRPFTIDTEERCVLRTASVRGEAVSAFEEHELVRTGDGRYRSVTLAVPTADALLVEAACGSACSQLYVFFMHGGEPRGRFAAAKAFMKWYLEEEPDCERA